MSVVGTVRVACPGCGAEQEVRLVQSINARKDRAEKQQLLDGELNIVTCACGRRTQLAGELLYADPDADYLARVCTEDTEEAFDRATALFRASGATGRQRLVPSLNALIEKVKLLDAGLDDWAIEMTKVLLLASEGDLARVLLFDRLDRDAGVIHWILFDEDHEAPRTVKSELEQYERLAAHAASKPSADELQIDRAWAVGAVQQLIAAEN